MLTTPRKQPLRLQTKVLLLLVAFSVIVGSAMLYTYISTQRGLHDYQILTRVRQLETTANSLVIGAENYLRVPARDYETYERDVAIFHAQLSESINGLENIIREMESELDFSGNSAANLLLGSGLSENLRVSVNQLRAAWNSFRSGYQERIGTNADEPRLEWGAEFIMNNSDLLLGQITETSGRFETVIGTQLDRARQLSQVSIGMSLLLGILSALWFYFNIVRRIQTTVDGCKRVALGDFGYQIPTKSDDELGQLTGAFNNLSARARLILSLLEKLQQRDSIADAVEDIWKESRNYLRADYLLFTRVSGNGKEGSVAVECDPGSSANKSLHGELVSLSGIFSQDDFNKASAISVDNLRLFSVANAQARFAREIGRAGFRAALFVPLTANNNWRGLLVFASKRASAFSDEQLKLLKNLSPMLAQGLARSDRTRRHEAA